MPAQEVLKKRLLNAGFGHFEEKTKLSERFTESESVLSDVALEVELALCDYEKYLRSHGSNPRVFAAVHMRKSQLLAKVFQDTPEAIKFLNRVLEEFDEDPKEITEKRAEHEADRK